MSISTGLQAMSARDKKLNSAGAGTLSAKCPEAVIQINR
jgi:hypothetical protein